MKIVLDRLCRRCHNRAMPPATPSAEHSLLQQFVGTFDTVSEFAIPGAPEPFRVTGRETCRLDMGGFWIVFDLESGEPPLNFRGHGIMGYDTLKQKFVGVWVDPSAAALQLSEGSVDAAGKVFTMLGTMPDYFGNGKEIVTRQISRIVDADTKEFEVWRDAAGAASQRVAFIRYTRRLHA